MKKTTSKILALMLALTMVFALTACGSNSAVKESGNYYSYDSYDGGAMYEEAAYAPAAAADSPASYLGASNGDYARDDQGSGNKTGNETGEDTFNAQKIIYSASATIETTEFDESEAKLKEMVTASGGFIESSSTNGNNYYSSSRGNASSKSAHYTIRVPSSNFSDLLESLSTLGNVPSTNVYTENITAQYYDVEARMKAYEAQEQRLMEMIEIADTVEDLITIEERLAEVRYSIDSMKAQLRNWDRSVNYSTISINLKEVTVYTPEAKMTFWQQLKLAVKNGLSGAGDFIKGLVLFLAEALPILVVVLPLIWLVVFIIRKIFKGSKARREKREAKRAAKKAEKAAKKAEAARLKAEAKENKANQ